MLMSKIVWCRELAIGAAERKLEEKLEALDKRLNAAGLEMSQWTDRRENHCDTRDLSSCPETFEFERDRRLELSRKNLTPVLDLDRFAFVGCVSNDETRAKSAKHQRESNRHLRRCARVKASRVSLNRATSDNVFSAES